MKHPDEFNREKMTEPSDKNGGDPIKDRLPEKNHSENSLPEQYIQLKQENELLEKKILDLSQSQTVNQVLFRITNALSTAFDLNQLYNMIHQALSKNINVPCFFIALYDKDRNSVDFPYYSTTQKDTDEQIANLEQTELLIKKIVNTGRSLMLTRKDFSQKYRLEDQHISFCPPEIWIGIPLKVHNEVIGVMAAQSYTNPNQYSKTDINLLHAVSHNIAIAIERKKTEDSLRESEERLTMALAANSEGIWDWNIDTDEIYIDPRMFQVLGYSADAFPNTYEQWEQKFHPEDTLTMRVRLLDHMKGKTNTFESELRVKTNKDSWIWLLCRGKVVKTNRNHRAARMIGTFTDITTQKKALTALEESEERFRTLQEASFGGIGIHEKGVILDANQGLASLTGYLHNELIGMNGLMLIDESTRDMVMKKIISGYEKPYDAVGIRKDGSTYPLEIQGKGIPYHGRAVRVTEFRDITERKKAEEALRESEERYRILSDVTLEGIIFHENAIAIDINNSFAKMFGYEHHEIIGKNYVDLLVSPEFRETVYQNIASRAELPFEISMIQKNGSVFPVEIEARNVEYKNRSIRAASIRDISEQKRTEDHLIQLQKMEAIGTLAGGVAHDFNNLLGGILGNAALMKMHLSMDSPSYKKVLTIEKIVHRGANLAKQLLGFARGGKYKVVQIHMNSLIQDTLEMFGRTCKNIQIHTHLQKELWTVEGDRTQLEQVILNLLINSNDAMPEGGDIFIDTRNTHVSEIAAKKHLGVSGDLVSITVRDTGFGMDKETKSKIFDPFFTTKEQGKGTGLGLSSAYGIIKNHNGQIDVYSEPNKGTIFKIFLPASTKKIDQTEKTDYQLKKGNETILLIDDEYDFRDTGEEMLRILGYEVITAKNGRHATEIFSTMPDTIDLIILDMIMPVMGGGDAYNELKKIRPNVKIILSSGYTTDNEAAEILSRGCNNFIQKPFDIIELSIKVRETLDSN